ncbi:MAG: glycosyltransferase family 4 protein, partial [Clostridia bacterium]|nr:glycosyltransferase family 4 protein [Deltaproteobacteria bacterium]
SQRFPKNEVIEGVNVFRVPFSSFGKSNLPVRLAGALSFSLQSTLHAVLEHRPDVILVSTSPPMCSAVGALVARLRKVPLVYWVMDLNPDEIIAMGDLGKHHPAVHVMHALNHVTLHDAKAVIALDDFMAERLIAKGTDRARLHVVPPWPLDNYVEPVPHADNPFRKQHNLDGRTVFTFSGNMSRASPLTTFIDAAAKLRHRDDVRFMFIGGGSGKAEVETRKKRDNLPNVIVLPYQPLEQLRYSLSAADVHLVTLGDPMVGIIHPCKVYGAMAVARPVLYMGPKPSHIAAILEAHDVGWHVRHGDVAGTVSAIENIAALPKSDLEKKGSTARKIVTQDFSMAQLCGRLCNVILDVARKEAS